MSTFKKTNKYNKKIILILIQKKNIFKSFLKYYKIKNLYF